MKRNHRNFPTSLLQQYNFDTSTIGALAETSEEATASDEPAEQATTKPPAEVDSEDVEPSDIPADEGDKSKTNSSPSEAEENSEQEREEPPIPSQSKTRGQHLQPLTMRWSKSILNWLLQQPESCLHLSKPRNYLRSLLPSQLRAKQLMH